MGLLKLIGKIIILLITLAIFLVLIIIVVVKFKNETVLSGLLRREIIKNQYLVNLINLNQPGDARLLYLNSKELTIRVELGYLRNSKIEDEVEFWIKDMVFETIEKDVDVHTSILDIAKKEAYSDEDLNEIRESFIDRFESEPKLYVFYLTKREEIESNVGITLHRDTIFIFKDAMETLTEQGQTLKRLERSTLMHEWGHLLGVEHIDSPDCIMSDFIEVENKTFYQERDIPIKYCPETTQKLRVQSRRFAK